MQKYLMGLRNPLKCIVRIVGEICICWGDTLRRHTNSWWRSGRGKQGYSFAVQDPLYLSPLTVCNSKSGNLRAMALDLLSLTNAAKCLRNALLMHLLRNILLSADHLDKKFLAPQRIHSTIQISKGLIAFRLFISY